MAQPNRIAIVTGTSSGIGAALVDGLLKTGWEVIGIARRAVTRPGGLYHHLEMDLADGAALSAAAEEHIIPRLKERHGDESWSRVGLVNNAATLGDPRGLSHADPAALQHLFAVNITAPMVLAGVVVRNAPADAWLRIVNLS
ncbi:MAG: SDR family NAD(P)-dependent oxidoreductase, partial [Gemmatimonadetes bacterium]|nr:SDR family NAD(P)-dependent oxidoreductase [Gemmatimonadota bacterium]